MSRLKSPMRRNTAERATEQAAADFPIIEGRKRDAVGVFRPPEPQPLVGWWTRFCGCELLERERERMKDERTESGDRSLVRWVLKALQRYRGGRECLSLTERKGPKPKGGICWKGTSDQVRRARKQQARCGNYGLVPFAAARRDEFSEAPCTHYAHQEDAC